MDIFCLHIFGIVNVLSDMVVKINKFSRRKTCDGFKNSSKGKSHTQRNLLHKTFIHKENEFCKEDDP